MSDMRVSAVPTPHVFTLWPQVRPHLEKAAEYTEGRYEVGDILTAITDYGSQLWIAFTPDNTIKGAVVTNFNVYPRKKYLDLTFIGGDDGPAWKEPMIDILRRWAHDTGCDGVELVGRAGWAKIFKEDGCKLLWHNFELPAADSGLEV